LVEAGVQEVTLLGQTVNSYRDPSRALLPAEGAGIRPWTHTHPTTAREDESEFPALLRAIARSTPGLQRLRYTSPHPRHLTHSLILAHRELPVLARHVHLPVQSGSDRMLKRMIRRYSIAEYKERVGALVREVSGVTLSTDGNVGFPGEKSARLAELFELSERLRRAHLESLVGSRQAMLVEGRGRDGAFGGRSERNEIVHVACDLELTGEIVPVIVRRAFKNSLGAEVEPAWLAAARARRPAPSASAVSRRALPIAP